MSVQVFRIRPRRSHLFFTVKVFASCQAMRAYARRRPGSVRLPRTTRAAMRSWTVHTADRRGRWRRTNDLGEMLLVRRYLFARVVTHECAHLALAWARRRRLDLGHAGDGRHRNVSTDEERFCYALGELVAATYRQLERRAA